MSLVDQRQHKFCTLKRELSGSCEGKSDEGCRENNNFCLGARKIYMFLSFTMSIVNVDASSMIFIRRMQTLF